MRAALSVMVVLAILASSIGITFLSDDTDAYDDVFLLYDTLSDDEKDAYDRLYETVVNYEDYCEFTDLFENTGKVYYALASDHPELFWFWNAYGWYWWMDGTSFIRLEEGFILDEAVNIEKMAAVEKAASKLIFNGTDYEKIKQIYDYLAVNIYYEYAENNQNLYGAIIDGRCVCAGYSQAFDYLCKINGLDCIVLRHQAENPSDSHLWNAVRLDGKWYQVDATWDTSEREAGHRYFLVGLDSSFIKSHGDAEFYFGLDYSDEAYDYPSSPSTPNDLIYLGHDWIDRNKDKGFSLRVGKLTFDIDSGSWDIILKAMESSNAYHISIHATVEDNSSEFIRDCNIEMALDGVPLDVDSLGLEGKILFSLGNKKTLYDEDGNVITDRASYSQAGIYRVGSAPHSENSDIVIYIAITAAVLVCVLSLAYVVIKKRKGVHKERF